MHVTLEGLKNYILIEKGFHSDWEKSAYLDWVRYLPNIGQLTFLMMETKLLAFNQKMVQHYWVIGANLDQILSVALLG